MIIIFALLVNNNFVRESHGNNVDSIKYKYGLAYIKGEPCYFYPYEMEGGGLLFAHPDILRNYDDKSIIKDGIIKFRHNYVISVFSSIKKTLYTTWIEGSEKKYKYKIENQRGFISTDGNEWDQLKLKVLSEKIIPIMEGINMAMKIELSCKWFNGIYSIELTDENEEAEHKF